MTAEQQPDRALAEEERRAEVERLSTERNEAARSAEEETGEQPLILPGQEGSTEDRTVEGDGEGGDV